MLIQDLEGELKSLLAQVERIQETQLALVSCMEKGKIKESMDPPPQ